MGATNLIPTSFRNTPSGQKLAKTLDGKTHQIATLRAENKELEARPSRFQRGVCVGAGAGGTGLILAFLDDPKLRIGVSAGLGIAGTIAGAAVGSDVVFDVGVGAGAVATSSAVEAAARAARAKLAAAASQVTGESK